MARNPKTSRPVPYTPEGKVDFANMSRREIKKYHKNEIGNMTETAAGTNLRGQTIKQKQKTVKAEYVDAKREKGVARKVAKANQKRAINAARTGKSQEVLEMEQKEKVNTRAYNAKKRADTTHKVLTYAALGTALTPAVKSVFGDEGDKTRTGTSE